MSDSNNAVTVVDVQMPFMSLVVFLVRLLIAAIPAMIISTIILSVLWAILIGGIRRTIWAGANVLRP